MDFRKIFLFAIPLGLCACAFMLEGPMRPVQIVTPGAQGAVCNVYANQLRFKVRPPEIIRLPQSRKDLKLDCRAPGNRRKKIMIDPDLSVYGFFNIATAGFGLAWDILSGAMFIYPRVIEVDFTDVGIRDMALPAHNNPDIKQPEEYELEEFLPGYPVLNKDKYAPVSKLKRRQMPGGDTRNAAMGEESFAPQGKGDLMTVIQDLRNQIDPTITGAQESSGNAVGPIEGTGSLQDGSNGAPIPLYAGE